MSESKVSTPIFRSGKTPTVDGNRSVATGGWTPPPSFAPSSADLQLLTDEQQQQQQQESHRDSFNRRSISDNHLQPNTTTTTTPLILDEDYHNIDSQQTPRRRKSGQFLVQLSTRSFDERQHHSKQQQNQQQQHQRNHFQSKVFVPDSASSSISDLDMANTTASTTNNKETTQLSIPKRSNHSSTGTSRSRHSESAGFALDFEDGGDVPMMVSKTPPRKPQSSRKNEDHHHQHHQHQQHHYFDQHHIDARPLVTGHYDEDKKRHKVQVEVDRAPRLKPKPPAAPEMMTMPPPSQRSPPGGRTQYTPPMSPETLLQLPGHHRNNPISEAAPSSPSDITIGTLTPVASPKPKSPPLKKSPLGTSRHRPARINWDDTVPMEHEDYDAFEMESAPLGLPSQPWNPSSHSNNSARSQRSLRVKSMTPKPTLSRKSLLIGDKDKLETRWAWNQLLVSKSFAPYRRMICELDDLLPDPDELDSFRDDDHDDDKDDLEVVRSAMLEDLELSEREIASFFEGFTLFKMKVRSLQAQLNATKMVASSRAPNMFSGTRLAAARSLSNVYEDDDECEGGSNWKPLTTNSSLLMGPSPRGDLQKTKSGLRQTILLSTKGLIVPPPLVSEPTGLTALTPLSMSKSQPRNLGKSLRMLSIRKVQKSPETNEEVQKLLKELEEAEKRQKKLEKQLQQAGVVIAEDIPYEEAKKKVESIAKRMQEIGGSDAAHPDPEEQKKLREEYFRLEQDMEKYNAALTLTDEWIEEQEEMEQKWEDDNAPGNAEALIKVRRHMPVNVRNLSEDALSTTPTPNGQYIPREMAKKFKRTNVLQLLRLDPDDILRMHPSTLENMRVTGLTLTERRALYAHLKNIGPRWKSMQADKMTERKWVWYNMMKTNFKENLESYLRHIERYGPPGNHPYATRDNPDGGCPLLGKQCPLKADKVLDYDGDLGFTPDAEYEVSEVRKSDVDDPGARAKQEALEQIREKKAGERSETLKKHYKNNVLQVSLANGSCEAMDGLLDSLETYQQKWLEERFAVGADTSEETSRKEMVGFNDALNEVKLAVLQFADRSGMQLTGKKDANADNPDVRSPVELGLCEEICEIAEDFFKGIEERMKEIKLKDGRMKSSIEQLRDLLEELHERNLATLAKLECPRPNKSRKIKTRKEIISELKKKAAITSGEDGPEEQAVSRDVGGGGGGRGALLGAIAAGRGRGGEGGAGRGDLMSAIAGRGRGRGGGRGDLMSAIAGRGRGADDSGRGGGRGDLMSAIAGRGRGGDNGGGGGGRGDLLSAIAGRGRGGNSGGGGGGRGDLMAAIAGRGRGRETGGGGGGRGDLMAAIAGRGRGGENGGGGGGRGDLMAAIAGRGRAVDDGGSGGGSGKGESKGAIAGQRRGDGEPLSNDGRGDLMAAIVAKAEVKDGAERVPVSQTNPHDDVGNDSKAAPAPVRRPSVRQGRSGALMAAIAAQGQSQA